MLLAPKRDPDALDIPIPRTNAEAVSGPWASYWIVAKEAEMASNRSKGTNVDAVPLRGANVVSGMWLYKVKRPAGAPPVFKVRYVVRGFSQREGIDFFQTFAPTLKMITLQVFLHIAAHRDYEVISMLIRWFLATKSTHGSRVVCLHSDREGLVMEITGTSMIHACAPHYMWPYAVRYAAHQLNL
ncbi:unnamed protein product [Closterium sp. NIES-54]